MAGGLNESLCVVRRVCPESSHKKGEGGGGLYRRRTPEVETDSGSACRRSDSRLFVGHMRVKDFSGSTAEVCLVSTSVQVLFDLLINIHSQGWASRSARAVLSCSINLLSELNTHRALRKNGTY